MMKRAGVHPSSVGVILENTEMEFIPPLDESTQIYNLQEFGGRGKSYWDMLASKAKKKKVDKEDIEELKKIIDFIAKIHKIKHPSKDKKQLTAVYNDSLRAVIGHPEYLLMFLHDIPDDYPVLPPSKQGKFVALMIENMHYFKNHPERLTALHGDFWGANLFFKKDGGIYAVDYSRMPWGDPAFDVGFWASQYIFRWHLTRNDYYKELCEKFLEMYIEETGDKEIRNSIIYSLGLVVVIYVSPKFIKDLDIDVRKRYYDHVVKMLKKEEFFW